MCLNGVRETDFTYGRFVPTRIQEVGTPALLRLQFSVLKVETEHLRKKVQQKSQLAEQPHSPALQVHLLPLGSWCDGRL